MSKTFEEKYPNLARWVHEHEGQIEIGYDCSGHLNSFIRAIDRGGMMIEGRSSYDDVDTALLELDAAVQGALIEIYGE